MYFLAKNNVTRFCWCPSSNTDTSGDLIELQFHDIIYRESNIYWSGVLLWAHEGVVLVFINTKIALD